MHPIKNILLAGLLAVAGCSTLPGKFEQPSLHLADVRLIEASLFEQRFVMSLRVQNPNDFDLPIEALAYELILNDKTFAKGASTKGTTIPRYGSGVLDVEGISTLSNVLRQLPETKNGNLLDLRYQLKGHLKLQGLGGKVPFDYHGEFGAIKLLPEAFVGKGKAREF